MITKPDQKGIDFLVNNEGIILHPYPDSNGTPTIGVGMTWYPLTGIHVTMKDSPITLKAALYMFDLVRAPFEKSVAALTRGLLSQDKYNACLDFTYQEGISAFTTSTLRKLILANQDDPKIEAEFLKWDKEHKDGKLVANPDIKRRRERDILVYFKGEYTHE